MTPVRVANALRRSLGSIETRLTVLRAQGDNAPTTSTKARWTEEDEKRLVELKDAGTATFEIATTLGRTMSAVTSRLYLLKARAAKE